MGISCAMVIRNEGPLVGVVVAVAQLSTLNRSKACLVEVVLDVRWRRVSYVDDARLCPWKI